MKFILYHSNSQEIEPIELYTPNVPVECWQDPPNYYERKKVICNMYLT